MTARSRPGHMRKTRLLAGAAVLFTAAILVGTSGTSSAAPCDIYASGGTPCVAAHSTTRALFDAYNGPLYQVRRSSDNATRDIGLLSAGGSADAAAQSMRVWMQKQTTAAMIERAPAERQATLSNERIYHP